jgi:RHS repeat-associated protein
MRAARRLRLPLAIAVFLIVFSCCLLSSASAENGTTSDDYRLIELTPGLNSVAVDINDNGLVVGSMITLEGEYHTFTYNVGKGRLRDLGMLNFSPVAINNAGTIVGSRYDSENGGDIAIAVTPSGAEQVLGHFTPADINDAGVIVGWDYRMEEDAWRDRPVIYDSGGLHVLGSDEGFDDSWFSSINNSRQIVGASLGLCFDAQRGFTYEDGLMTLIAAADGFGCPRASAINDLGNMIGSADRACPGEEGCIESFGVAWIDGQVETFDDPRPAAINDRNDLLLTSYFPPVLKLRKDGATIDLTDLLPEVTGKTLNNYDEIVANTGNDWDLSGQHAYVLTPRAYPPSKPPVASPERSFGPPSDTYKRPTTETYADPVNTGTANFYHQETDASLNGPGISFNLTRNYNSLDETSGPFGKGWASSLFPSLATDDAGNVQFRADTGQRIEYALQPDGSYAADSDVSARLTKTDSGFALRLSDQSVQRFDQEGRIVSWLDSNGVGLTYTYDDAGQLVSVMDGGGRQTSFSYDSDGHFVEATLPDGRVDSYGYDGDLLVSVTDAKGAITHYAYDGSGRMTKVTDPTGDITVENSYSSDGYVTSQLGALGQNTDFEWSSTAGTAIDAANGSWQDTYNENGQLTSRTDPLGNTTHYTYDSSSDLISSTDQLGAVTEMTYDERGNMLTRTTPDGAIERWTYDENNHVTSHTDQLGNVTRDVYDEKGNLVKETDPLGAVTTYSYNERGQVVAETDPLGRTTHSVYDDSGDLIATISPTGAKKTMSYDTAGRLIAEVSPRGNVEGADPDRYTTTYKYDANGRLIEKTDPLGHTTKTAYDAAGNVASETDAKGNVTRYEYDGAGHKIAEIAADGGETHYTYDAVGKHVIAETDPLGNVTRYTFDAAGRQTSVTSPSGAKTTYAYDAAGNQISTKDPLGNTKTTKYDAMGRPVEATDALGGVTKTVYDAAGKAISVTDPLGHEATSTYDAAGRLIKKTDPLGHETTSTYDAAGQLVVETDANGHTTRYTYDADGRKASVKTADGAVTNYTYNASGDLTRSKDGNGHVTTYGYNAVDSKTSMTNALDSRWAYRYDANGNQVATIDPLGNRTTTKLDAMNREIAKTDPLGDRTKTAYDLDGHVVLVTDPRGRKTTSSYDSDGRLVGTTDPLAHETTYSYDADGRVISLTDAKGHTTGYGYDAIGRKVSITAPDDSVTTNTYDAAGNLTQRTDANGHLTSYAYDAAGRKISMSNALGSLWTYSYDAVGNLTRTAVPSGGTIARSYDAVNRPLGKVYSDGTSAVSYAYDKAGNRISMTDGTGATTYAYDAANRLTGVTNPRGNFAYSYDANGNLLSRTYPNGRETGYTYDAAGRMSTATTSAGATTYTYDKAGNLVSTLHPNGILDSRAYDGAERLTQVQGTRSDGTIVYSRSYKLDPVGNPRSLDGTDSSAQSGAPATSWTETYTYDSNDRLTKACMDDSCTRYYKYSYDGVGNRLSQKTEQGTTRYTYDAADELTKEITPGPDVVYAYDANGNETRKGTARYTYNLENEPTVLKKDGVKVASYVYTGDGLLEKKAATSGSIFYSWDMNASLPQLALERGSQQGTVLRAYSYGAGPLELTTPQGTLTYHTDSLGSVVGLTNTSGNEVASYRYSPYGQEWSSDGSTPSAEADANPLRFTGQYLDSDSELYYLRAREYDSETGRFLEVDPLEAQAGDAAVAVYVYADDDPTLKMDPGGASVMDPYRDRQSCKGSSCRGQRKVVHVVVIVAKHSPETIENAVKGANRAASQGGRLMHASDPALKSLGSSLLNQSKGTKLIRSTKVANGLWVASFAIDSYDIYQSTKKGSRAASVETTGTIFAWGGTVGGVIVCGAGTYLSGVGAAGCGAITIVTSEFGRYLGRKIGNTLYRPGYLLGGKAYDLYSWRP